MVFLMALSSLMCESILESNAWCLCDIQPAQVGPCVCAFAQLLLLGGMDNKQAMDSGHSRGSSEWAHEKHVMVKMTMPKHHQLSILVAEVCVLFCFKVAVTLIIGFSA